MTQPVFDPSLFKYILRYSWRAQLFIVFVTLASLPFYYASLDVPKQIINKVLDTGHRDHLRPPAFLGIELDLFHGDRFKLLGFLCAIFLFFTLVNGGFKLYINVLKGRLGERMLRRLRYQLYDTILRFPLPHFRKTSEGEMINMITAEVEPVGGFIGDAFVVPLYQGGLLFTAIFFIFMQDWRMGLASVVLYPIQGYVIPKLQRRVRLLGKDRVREMRKVSERIGDTVNLAREIRAHNTVDYERADYSDRMGRVYTIRFRIYNLKFFVKFLNNFLTQMTPFLFVSIGGYLVIEGQLSVGALVAALAAQKDLLSPWNELLNNYQIQQDSQQKYEQVVTAFNVEGLMPVEAPPERVERLAGDVVARDVSVVDEDVTLLERLNFAVSLDERVAVVGPTGSGKDVLAQLVAGLVKPSSGSLKIGGKEIVDLPAAVLGRRIAYVGGDAGMMSGTLGDNLHYVLKHRPVRPPEFAPNDAALRRRALAESAIAGNSVDDVAAQWIDYEALDVGDEEGLKRESLAALACADMMDDVYQLGLRVNIDAKAQPDLVSRLLRARAAMRARLAEPANAALVEPFNPQSFIMNATLAENLFFGTADSRVFDPDNLGGNTYVRSVLKRTELEDEFADIGVTVAGNLLELAGDLPAGNTLLAEFSVIRIEDLPQFRPVVDKARRDGTKALSGDEKAMVLSVPFKLVPLRDRHVTIGPTFKEKMLQARRTFADGLPSSLKGRVEFFDPERFNSALTLRDNILFGKVALNQAQAPQRANAMITEVIAALDLRDTIVEAGLAFHVGTRGSRLSAAQRQKLAIARALLKNPDLMVLADATTALDAASDARLLDAVLKRLEGKGVIWALQKAGAARRFDRVLVMADGSVAEEGSYSDLAGNGGKLAALVKAE
ncbi:MAG: ATP-binding cassette domain-containing protein [Alphaproteobacteria bacterium]|nr:ATP-binding cassette domain-containing protein [Alphaproteobacteria bacterium]